MFRRKDTLEVSRRDLLKIGSAGLGLGLFACSAGDLVEGEEEASATTIPPTNAFYDAVIQIWFGGGPSQTDTFDPKPGSSSNMFTTASLGANDKYNQPIYLTSALPNIRTLVQSGSAGLGIIRSMVHPEGNHEGATVVAQSLWGTIGPAMLYPTIGSVMAYYYQGQSAIGIPSVAIDGEINDTKGNPIPGALNAGIGNMGPVLNRPVTAARYDRRNRMLTALNTAMLGRYPDTLPQAVNDASRDAYSITSAGVASAAFNLTGKTLLPGTDGGFRERMTLAQELVKAGVRYVALGIGGNDSHENNRATINDNWGANADPAVAQLATNLIPTGKRVLILMGGEFGRTPRIPTDPAILGDGRDHWNDGFSWGFVSINQPKFRTGAFGNTGPDGTWTADNGTLIDPCQLKDFGGFLYRALGFQVGNPTYNIPLIGFNAPPVDPTNKSTELLNYFGLV